MKYEITKGSEKDFDGAPEWAMQVATCRGDEDNFFVDEFDYMCRYQRKSSTANGRISNPTFWKVIAERRPITEPVVNQQLTNEWDGAGIAHLGQHIEYYWGEGKEWRKAEVVAHYEEWPLLKDIEDGLMVAELNNKMRPIRSPEDVADAIASATGLLKYGGRDQVSKDIYDAIAAGKIPGITLSGK